MNLRPFHKLTDDEIRAADAVVAVNADAPDELVPVLGLEKLFATAPDAPEPKLLHVVIAFDEIERLYQRLAAVR